MWFSTPGTRVPKYEKDEDGNTKYFVDDAGYSRPIETGEYTIGYSSPVEFRGYIGSQLEDAITRAWGSDNTNNFAVLVLDKYEKDANGDSIDFQNGTLIWRKNKPSVLNFDYTSAEYEVDGVMDEELNETSYYLRKRK